jgi:hypothetical protein
VVFKFWEEGNIKRLFHYIYSCKLEKTLIV